LLTGCGQASRRPVVAGSTSAMYPVGILAESWERGGGQPLAITGVGSTAGLLALERGQAALAMISRALTPAEEAKGLEAIPIAYDLLVVVVHPSNPVESLTQGQLQAIWERWVTDWWEVGGPTGLRALPHGREYGSGSEAVWSKVIGTENYDLPISNASGFLRWEAMNDPRAVTYISFRHFRLGGVKAIKVDGISHTDPRYPLRHPIFLVVGPKSPPVTRSFIQYARSPVGQRILAEEGLIPLVEAGGGRSGTATP
jgi:phosphate transport system substrate-binding protein